MAANLPPKNRQAYVANVEKLADGFTKHGSLIPQIVIANTTTTPAEVVTKLEARVTQAKAVDTTHASWQTAVQADHDATAQLKPTLSLLRQMLLTRFAGQIDVLADFGLTERKIPVISPAARAAAALKAKATRAARGTIGKNQKAEIVANVVVTPATATPAKTVPVTELSPAPAPTAATPPAPSLAISPTPAPSPAPQAHS